MLEWITHNAKTKKKRNILYYFLLDFFTELNADKCYDFMNNKGVVVA